MAQEESSILSTGGGTLYVKTWFPTNKPKAVVVLVHGFGEHCSRYSPYIELFTKNNIAFVGFDHYGHGQSSGKRGCIKSYQQLLDDVELAINKADEIFPNIPKFIYGHSMGGNIALNFLLQKKHSLKGGIISSPWLQLSKEPPGVVKNVVSVLQAILPNITVDSGLDLNYISTIKEEVDAYRNDPLNHGRISFRLVHNISKQGIWAIENSSSLTVPAMFTHGNGDKITSHQATKLAAKYNTELIQYVEFAGMYHEVHNDTARKDLAKKCIAFINENI